LQGAAKAIIKLDARQAALNTRIRLMLWLHSHAHRQILFQMASGCDGKSTIFLKCYKVL